MPIIAINHGTNWTKERYAVFQWQLAGVARMICADLGLPCCIARVNTVRAYFCRVVPISDTHGRPIAPKDRVGMACVRRGWPVSNDHEADAGAILAWRLAQQQEARSA